MEMTGATIDYIMGAFGIIFIAILVYSYLRNTFVNTFENTNTGDTVAQDILRYFSIGIGNREFKDYLEFLYSIGNTYKNLVKVDTYYIFKTKMAEGGLTTDVIKGQMY